MTTPNPRPLSVMVRAHGEPSAILAHDSFLSRASLEACGWAFLADFPGYFPAAERALAFEALPAVERWWSASWAARAGREDA